MRTGNAAGSTNLKKPCRSDLQRFVFFNSCGTCWSRQTNTYTSMYIYIYIQIYIYIRPWITIYDLFNTIRHQLTKVRRTHLATKKKQRSHIDLHFASAGRPATPITRHGFGTPCQPVFRRTAFPPGGMPVLFRSGGHCTVSWSSFCRLPF